MKNNKLNEIFKSIKGSLEQDKTTGASDILKMEPGNTYTVRLLPAKDAAKTFFHHFVHGWTSYSTGKYVSALSLQTFGERDPISEARYKVIKTGSESEQERAKTIRRAEKWLVNVYVVNDPTNPDNNGKVKIMRYGKQLEAIISSAVKGDGDGDDSALGARVFDLGSDGVNLKVKVDKQGDFPTFVSSKFTLPCALPDVSDEKAEKIYGSVFDLTTVIPVKSADELKKIYEEHFELNNAANVKEQTQSRSTAPQSSPVKVGDTSAEDEEVRKLLDGFEVH